MFQVKVTHVGIPFASSSRAETATEALELYENYKGPTTRVTVWTEDGIEVPLALLLELVKEEQAQPVR